jgi:hypothetical protein
MRFESFERNPGQFAVKIGGHVFELASRLINSRGVHRIFFARAMCDKV